MTLGPGSRLGQHEIAELVGEGGMGRVYRARDPKLDRDVAIKVLPPELAGDAERVARFRREAKLLASLSHPNIAGIHGFDDDGARHYLVMELVEGQSLDRRLREGAIDPDEALEVARQVAEGLESAHARGVVHRDLKPANVMVRPDGQVKILDFGLAKALVENPQGSGGLSQSPTMLTGETQQGVLLGTAAYMSPEQARGKTVDSRTDVWAFGCVLYEMLTGARPFDGESVSDTLASVLKDRFDEAALPAGTPGRVRRLIRRCLVRDPRQRLQSIGDARIVLQEVIADPEEAPGVGLAVARSPVRRALPWVAVLAIGLAGVLVGKGLGLDGAAGGAGPAETAPAAAAPLRPTRLHPLTGFSGIEMGPSWSPDGNLIAFAHGDDGPLDIYVMPRAGGAHVKLVESEYDDMSPRWSPDGRWIVFVSNRGNKTGVYLVPPLGGPVRPLTDTRHAPLSLVSLELILGERPWSPDGSELVFSRATESGGSDLVSIGLGDGVETVLTSAGPRVVNAIASFSWDGTRIAYVRNTGADAVAEVRVLDRATGAEAVVTRVPGVVASVTWAPADERILYGILYGALPGIWSVELDGTGAQPITVGPMFGAEVAVSAGGRLATATVSHVTDLHLQPLDGGASRRLTTHSGDNFEPQVSPDGRTVAYTSSRRGVGDIWLLDLETGEERALASHEAMDSSPAWSPDGRQVLFVSWRDELPGLWVVDVEGRRPRRLTETSMPSGSFWSSPSWSPDGERIGFVEGGVTGSSLFSVDERGENRELLLEDVQEFDWYRDSKRVVYLTGGTGDGRPAELRARHLETSEEVVLFRGPHVEIQMAADGSAVSFCRSSSHYDMNLQVLRLREPDEPGGLPRAAGAPEIVAHGRGEWHVHNGGFTPDGRAVVYTRDTDTADVYELEGVFGSPDGGS